MDWPPRIKPPPSVHELITDDGIPLESNRHVLQMILLRETLESAWAGRNDYFVGTNLFLYYSTLQTKRNDFRSPDVFVVLGTARRDREAWVIWEEDGKHPDVVIELTSDSTRRYDQGEKKADLRRAHRRARILHLRPPPGRSGGLSIERGQARL
ncbi:MAG TPA: Uma2 family endonuclease [Polyangia bacterium]|jgi:Uma2 family endonuclease|nr:Uma2 family endonuclease [Polyangia bacterium]